MVLSHQVSPCAELDFLSLTRRWRFWAPGLLALVGSRRAVAQMDKQTLRINRCLNLALLAHRFSMFIFCFQRFLGLSTE